MDTLKQNMNTKEFIEETGKIMEEGNTCVQENVQERDFKKKAGDAQIVVAMVMIVIALVLCFLFKNQITTFMTTAISTMSTKMSTLLNGLD